MNTTGGKTDARLLLARDPLLAALSKGADRRPNFLAVRWRNGVRVSVGLPTGSQKRWNF